MIFFWVEDKYAKAVPIGKNIKGLQYNRKRPDFVFLSPTEVEGLEQNSMILRYGLELPSVLSRVRNVVQKDKVIAIK